MHRCWQTSAGAKTVASTSRGKWHDVSVCCMQVKWEVPWKPFISGQSCSSGSFFDLVRARSFLGKQRCSFVSPIWCLNPVFLQSFVCQSICHKSGFMWPNNANCAFLLMEIKLSFCSLWVCCMFAILSKPSRTALPKAPSCLCPQFIYTKPSSYTCVLTGILVSDLIQCCESFLCPLLWNVIANSLIYAFWSSVCSAACPRSQKQTPFSLPMPPQCSMTALCCVSLWLQAKLNTVWFTLVSCHSPSLSSFLSWLFHTPVLYSTPLARIILSHVLDKGLGGQKCMC